MKICILTQPLTSNYGGLLQAFALQKVLKCMGHEVRTVKRSIKYDFIKKIRLNCSARILLGKYTKPDENTKRFIANHINTTSLVRNSISKVLAPYCFDAYIVGSDQVWRPKYSPNLSEYFLDFCQGEAAKKISFAASFGTDKWEFSQKETQVCRNLIKQFDAISVREDSGVDLCKKHFGVSAEHHLDPTLLLDKEVYLNTLEESEIEQQDKVLMCYVLDKSKEKQEFIEHISNKLQLCPLSITASKETKWIFPSVSKWIAGFRDAEFVVTDSFHGTVFSIIFNKPFITIANKKRGASRFVSLLKIFGLEYRLLSNISDIRDEYLQPIDYTQINVTLDEWRNKSLDFLRNSLQE